MPCLVVSSVNKYSVMVKFVSCDRFYCVDLLVYFMSVNWYCYGYIDEALCLGFGKRKWCSCTVWLLCMSPPLLLFSLLVYVSADLCGRGYLDTKLNTIG